MQNYPQWCYAVLMCYQFEAIVCDSSRTTMSLVTTAAEEEERRRGGEVEVR